MRQMPENKIPALSNISCLASDNCALMGLNPSTRSNSNATQLQVGRDIQQQFTFLVRNAALVSERSSMQIVVTAMLGVVLPIVQIILVITMFHGFMTTGIFVFMIMSFRLLMAFARRFTAF